MIHAALKIIAKHLNDHISKVKDPEDGVLAPYAILENISHIAGGSSNDTNKILLSMINTTEGPILKDTPPLTGEGIERTTTTHNLDILLLFSVRIENYEVSLKYLSWIYEFFLGNSIFDLSPSNIRGERTDNYKIFINHYSLTLEQLYYLWGTLGRSQLPSLCYKVRIMPR